MSPTLTDAAPLPADPADGLSILESPKSAAETFGIPLAGVIDFDAEKARLGKEDAKLSDDIQKIEKKLDNEQFLQKAAEEVVEEQRDRLAEATDRRSRIRAALVRLS